MKVLTKFFFIIILFFNLITYKENYNKNLCDVFLPMQEHYDVISSLLNFELGKEDFVFIQNYSDSLEYIFDNGPMEENIKKFLYSIEDGEYIFLRAFLLKERRCRLEKKFKVSFRYKLVSEDYEPKIKVKVLKTDQGYIKRKIYEHPMVSFSLPVFNESMKVCFVMFSYTDLLVSYTAFITLKKVQGRWEILKKFDLEVVY